MKDYFKSHKGEIIMQYLGSLLIVFIIGYLMNLNLFSLFIVDTIIIFLDFLVKYRDFQRDNKNEL